MTITELLGNLREFYLECSNRGWCKVDKKKGKDFLTLYSSETNFTHLPLNYGNFPERVWVSPKLSGVNLKKIELILSSFDSTRIVSLSPSHNGLRFKIITPDGKVIFKEKIRLYTFKRYLTLDRFLENSSDASF